MKRAGLIPVLAAAVLLGMSAQAQSLGVQSWQGSGMHVGGQQGVGVRAGGGHRGGARIGGARGGIGARGGEREFTHSRHRGRGEAGNAVFFFDPFWYDEWGEPYFDEYGQPYGEYEPPEQPPVGPVLLPPPPPPQPERIPSNPKMLEIPAPKKAAAAKPLPPAVFILTSGERLESSQYLLTAKRVQLTVDRRQRSIPLDELDLKATLAVNRERGLDLRIPNSSSEISLGF